jgi:hypothetical protein
VKAFFFVVLLALCAPALAVRATASATIVAPARLASITPSLAVAVTTVRDASYAYVTIEFN